MIKFNDSHLGIGPEVICMYYQQPHYSGFSTRKERREKLQKVSNLGHSTFRTYAPLGGFEHERDNKNGARTVYNKYLPIKDVHNPVINEDWLGVFKELIQDFCDANIFLTISAIGGCDMLKWINPGDSTHAVAVELYFKAIIKEMNSVFGENWCLELFNEGYAWPGTLDQNYQMMLNLGKKIVSWGVPWNRIVIPTKDNVPDMMYLAVKAWPKATDEMMKCVANHDWVKLWSLTKAYFKNKTIKMQCTAIEYFQRNFFTASLSSQAEVEERKKVGCSVSIHEIREPIDFQESGPAGRLYTTTCAKERLENNVHLSTDGAGKMIDGVYEGVTLENLKAIVKNFLTMTTNKSLYGVCHFNHLLNREALTADANGYTKFTWTDKVWESLTAMIQVVKEVTGKCPYNKLHPVVMVEEETEDPEPTSDPIEPGPVEPEPEEEGYVKLIQGVFDWHFKEWWAQFPTKKKVWIVWLAVVHLYAIVRTIL